MNPDRDPFIARALDTLEPPPPRPGFWDDLEGRLGGEPPTRATAAAPTALGPPPSVLPLAAPQPPERRRSRVMIAALSAAAVVALAVAIAIQGDGSREVRTARPPTTPPPTLAADPASVQAQDAARRWVEAAGRGDTDAAWELLGPQSRESIGGTKAALADLMASALREGWGAWASADDVTRTTVPLVTAGGDRIVIVTFAGLVTQEGTTGRASIPLAVRVRDGGALVEPFVPGTALGLIGRIDGPVPATGPVPLQLDVRPGYVVVVDGQTQPLPTLERSPSGEIVAWRPVSPLAPGRHLITVAYVNSGTIVLAFSSFEV